MTVVDNDVGEFSEDEIDKILMDDMITVNS